MKSTGVENKTAAVGMETKQGEERKGEEGPLEVKLAKSNPLTSSMREKKVV